MKPEIRRDGPVAPREIADLRQAVGWDRLEETYNETLRRHYAHYTVRDEENRLIGYMSVLSDEVSDAFLMDLAVHPHHQRSGIGRQIVRRAIRDLKEAGIQCVQVTFNDDLEVIRYFVSTLSVKTSPSTTTASSPEAKNESANAPEARSAANDISGSSHLSGCCRPIR